MKIRPKKGEVLLYMDPPVKASAGGLVFIESDSEMANPAGAVFGEVRKLGIWNLDRRGRMIPHPVKIGDRVMICSGSGKWLRSSSERLKVVRASSILATIEK